MDHADRSTYVIEHPIRAAARAIDHALKAVADVNPAFMTTTDKSAALVELAEVESRLAELRLRVVADADDVAEATGARDVACWAAAKTRRRRGDCARELRLATALAERPVLAEAVCGGRVNLDQAHAITASLADLPTDVGAEIVAEAEAALIGYAEDLDPSQLRRLGRRILDLVAPEISEAAEARHLADLEASAQHRMRLSLRATGDGTTRISGLIPDAAAARLATYLHAFTNPRRGSEPAVEQVERAPYGRQAAAAFCQLLETIDPDRLPLHGGDATTLVVTMTLESLKTDLATATLGNAAPGYGLDHITASEARRLACTATIVPAVLGSKSEVLDLGRTQRLYTKHQRRAMAIRDRHCRAQGCDIPAAWCEAHHRQPWSHGGETNLDDGELLCSHHHHLVHDPTYEVERTSDGGIRFHRRRQILARFRQRSASSSHEANASYSKDGQPTSDGVRAGVVLRPRDPRPRYPQAGQPGVAGTPG